jgi:tetratricopeptide (TPR) repeat protein
MEKTRLANTYLDLAFTFDLKGNYDSLVYWSSQVEDLIDSKSPLYGRYLVAESFKGKFDGKYLESIEKLLQAIEIFEEKGDLDNLAKAYISIAFFYGRLGDLKNQEEALLEALELKKSLSDIRALISVYNNLGVCLKNQARLKESIMYYDLAFELLEQMDSPLQIAQNLTNRGNIYEKLEDYPKAEELFLSSEKICEKNGITYGVILSNLNLGNLYRLMGRFSGSEVRLEKALALSKVLKTKREEYLALERLARLENDRGNFKKAYDYLTDFHTLKDSVINESVKKEALDLKEKYESEKKEKAIINLSKEKLYQKFIIASLGLSLVALLFAVMWIRNKNRLFKRKKEVEAQKLQFELELKEKELLSDSIRRLSIMNTKEYLAKELKDLMQGLPRAQAQKLIKIQKELANSRDDALLQEFETRFLGVYESFFERLKEFAPELTPTELRTAAMIRLNFTSKEIAAITNRSIGTIDNLRSSIRKKLQMGEEENLTQKLSDI